MSVNEQVWTVSVLVFSACFWPFATLVHGEPDAVGGTVWHDGSTLPLEGRYYTNAAGARKAWMVQKASPYDPRGTLIAIR